MTTEWIADEPVLVLHPDGRRTDGRIAIGEPRRTDDGFASCGVLIDFILPKVDAICGDTPLQALSLALQLAGTLLHDFLERGGRVLFADGSGDLPLEHIFGPMLRASPRGDGEPPPV